MTILCKLYCTYFTPQGLWAVPYMLWQCHTLTIHVSLKTICTIPNMGNLLSDIQNWYAYQSSVPFHIVPEIRTECNESLQMFRYFRILLHLQLTLYVSIWATISSFKGLISVRLWNCLYEHRASALDTVWDQNVNITCSTGNLTEWKD
jgi:hypothetical protein